MHNWATYSMGGTALLIGVVFAALIIQMRRTLVDVAARRFGHVAGALFGAGIAIIALRMLDDRLDGGTTAVAVVVFVAALALVAVLAHAAAQQAANVARNARTDRQPVQPTMPLEPGQRVVWSATLSSRWLLIPALGLLVFGPFILLAPEAPAWLLAVIVVAGIGVLSLASIRVTADAEGLNVKYGVLPWPRTQIAVDRIDSASVIDVRPMEWGGWGYRGTLALMRQAAVVLRAGPGIRLDLKDGRVFVVTIDEPETPVALLNGEVQRRS